MSNSKQQENFFLKHKNKLIAGAVILIVLVIVFFMEGGTKNTNDNSSGSTPAISTEAPSITTVTPTASDLPSNDSEETTTEIVATEAPTEAATPAPKPAKVTNSQDSSTETYNMVIESQPTSVPEPVAPQNAEVSDKELTCTFSIRCDTILNNISYFNQEKVDIVPSDGVIYAEKTVTFYEGESVFNVLLREMKQNKIHFEFVNTPGYNSAYIEGIANIYEFDCGDLSGWMYRVNGWFPNYGCSQYQLKKGDIVEIIYTCDLGKDIGGDYSPRNGR